MNITIFVSQDLLGLHMLQAQWMSWQVMKRDPFQQTVPCWHPAFEQYVQAVTARQDDPCRS